MSERTFIYCHIILVIVIIIAFAVYEYFRTTLPLVGEI